MNNSESIKSSFDKIEKFKLKKSARSDNTNTVDEIISTYIKPRRRRDKGKYEIIKAVDNEQQITVEIIYEPNVPDKHGDWISVEELKKACDNFNANLESGNVKPNLFHMTETDKFEILKTWTVEDDCFVGDQFITKGTWLGEFHFIDPVFWGMKKSGEIGGVSIGALGKRG